jgi:hypothetical protein
MFSSTLWNTQITVSKEINRSKIEASKQKQKKKTEIKKKEGRKVRRKGK